LQFKVGDKVIYPNHGIGVIEKIQTRQLSGNEQTYYTLRIVANDSTVMVPVSNTGTVGLRRLLSQQDVQTVISRLKEAQVEVQGDWKGRFQENSEKMRSGEVGKVADVLKSLTYLSSLKTLSYLERKMLDRARFLVVSELAEATQQPIEKVESQVDQALAVTLRTEVDH